MIARVVAAALLVAGCNAVPDPCAGVTSGCLAVTVTSATITQLDSIDVGASGAFSGMRSSSLGHAAPLPIHFRVTHPASASGNVHLDLVGKLSGADVGHGSGDVALRPGANASITIPLVGGGPGGAGGGDMAATVVEDLAGADLSATTLMDLGPGRDMYRRALSFMQKASYAAGVPSPTAIALGNFRGQGVVDVVVGGNGQTAVFLQDNTGGYPAAPSQTPFGSTAIVTGIGVGRWHTGASKQDFVFDDRSVLNVAGNNGSGVFTASQYPQSFSFGMGTAGIASADFNGDNADDIAFAVAHSNDSDVSASIAVAMSVGNGSFAQDLALGAPPPPNFYHLGGESATQIAAGDLKGTGKLDLVATGSGNDIFILHGDGKGRFTIDLTQDKHATGSTSGAGVVIADFDGNGKKDIAVANNGGSVSIFLNDGTGGFPATGTLVAAGMSPNGIVAADFDGDGHQDLAVTNSLGTTVSVLLGDGAGHFGTPVPITVGPKPAALAVSDLNADTLPDLVVSIQDVGGTDMADDRFVVLLNTSH